MAGILDFLQTPEAQLGIGLLAAGGPTTDPNRSGFGQRIAGALQGVTANQAAMTDAQLKKAQLANELQQTAVNAFQLKRLQDWQAMVTGAPTSGMTSPTGASPAGSAQAAGITPASVGGPMLIAGGAGTPAGGAPSMSQGANPGFAYALPGVGDQQSRAIAAILPPADYMKLYADKAAPQTDIGKLMVQAGIDPKSPLGMQLTQTAMAKANYTAPVNARPGSILRDPITNMPIAFNPHIPDGWTPQFDASGNVVGMSQIPNSGRAIASVEQAKGEGQQAAKPTVVFGPNNRPIFSSGIQDLNRANGLPVGTPAGGAPNAGGINSAFQGLPAPQGGMTSSFQGPAEQVLPLIAGIKDPQERANAYDAYARQLTGAGATQGPAAPPQADVTPVLAPGAEKGATLSQDELSTKGKDLQAANAAAQTVVARLQSIKMLAPQAITGGETARRDYFNSLLALAGVKGSEDSKTASDLVDKNSAQIVAALRMGQGGAGTDALQTLLGAANPNRKMSKEAIQDAADQLIAAQKMNQAKANILLPSLNQRDPVAYSQKENTFDQNADPRIWQLQSLPPDQQAAYIKKMPPDVAKDLLSKRQALKQLGAL